MNIKQKFCIEIIKNEHQFQFFMPENASWGNAIDAACEVLLEIRKQSQSAIDKATEANHHA